MALFALMALACPLLSLQQTVPLLTLSPFYKQAASRRVLTSERRYQHVSIFDEVFYKPVGSLQLYLMALQPLSELRAVQEGITELQRR